jgi:hypothetical protein
MPLPTSFCEASTRLLESDSESTSNFIARANQTTILPLDFAALENLQLRKTPTIVSSFVADSEQKTEEVEVDSLDLSTQKDTHFL